MRIKIASWNTEGRLSRVKPGKKRGQPDQILDAVRNLDADVLFLPEAHAEDSIKDIGAFTELRKMGYEVFDVPYDDDIPTRPDAFVKQLSMTLLSRLPIMGFEVIRPDDVRNMITCTVCDSEGKKVFRLIGVHLEDRSEAVRLRQVEYLSDIINSSELPVVMMGDFNAMYADKMPAALIRSRTFNSILGRAPPDLAKKAREMAIGSALSLLMGQTGLIDADNKRRPTTTPKLAQYEYLPSWRLIQIDHIFTSPGMDMSDFKISKDLGSDHRAISVIVTTASS